MYCEKKIYKGLYTKLFYAIIPTLFSYFFNSAIPTSYYIFFLVTIVQSISLNTVAIA